MRCNSGVIFDDVNYSEEKYRQLFADLCFTRLSVLFGSWSRQKRHVSHDPAETGSAEGLLHRDLDMLLAVLAEPVDCPIAIHLIEHPQRLQATWKLREFTEVVKRAI